MPRVQQYEQTVNVNQLPGPYQTGASSSTAFGSGRGLSNLGNSLARNALDMKLRDDRTKAKELSNQLDEEFRTILHDKDQGYYNTSGRAAYLEHDNVKDVLAKARKRIEEAAENDTQRELFGRDADAAERSAYDGMARFASREQKTWQQNTAKIRAESQLNKAIENRNDPAALSLAINSGREEVLEMARLQGIEGEEAEIMADKYTSGTHAAVLSSMLAAEETGSAQAYFEKNKDQITGQDRTKIEKQLEISVTRAEAQRLTDQLMATGSTLEERLEAARTIEDSKLRDEVVKRVKIRHSEINAILSEQVKQDRINAWEVVNGGGTPDDLSPEVLSRLGPTVTQLWNRVNLRKNNELLKTDFAEFNDMVEMATSSDPAERDKFIATDLSGDEFMSKMTRTSLDKLLTLQKQMKSSEYKAEQKLATINNAMSLAKAQLDQYFGSKKMSSKRAKEIGGIFREKLMNGLDALQADNKRATNEEIRGLISTLMTQVNVEDAGFAWFDSEMPLFRLEPGQEISPPSDFVAGFTNAYRNKNQGLAPTRAQVIQAYIEHQRRQQ